MRIVQVCPYDPDRHGGVQRHIHGLAAALSERGHETLIIAPGAPKSSRHSVWRLGAMRSVRFAGTQFEVTWAPSDDLHRTLEMLRAWKADIVHFHTLWDPVMPWQLFRRLVVSRVATFHDTPPSGATGVALRTLFKCISRYLLSKLDGAIAVSEAPLAHLCRGVSGVTPVVLPPVTDLSAFFGIDKLVPQRPTVLFLGRLEPRKGVHVLLEAATTLACGAVALAPGMNHPRFLVAGDGEMRGLVAETEAKLGTQWLALLPAPSRVQQVNLLREATIAVSPALYGESFGIVIAEALAGGTPIIGADNAGYRTVLTGTGASLLVSAGDGRALARRIVTLLGDADERRALAAWGRVHARQFDVRERVGDFEDFYLAAMARHARSKGEG